MPHTDELAVPDYTPANPDGGAERLDADKPSQSDMDLIDAALDAEESLESETDDQNSYLRDTTEIQDEEKADEPDQADSVEASNDQQANAGVDPDTAEVQMPPNMSEKQQSNWRKLTTKLTESASQAKRYAAELETLKQRIAQQEQAPKLPEDYEELKRFRATFDLKNDPEFKSKYDKPIKEISENIYGLLRKHKASDEIIKSIEEAGGPQKIPKAWWKRNIIDKLASTDDGFVDATRINSALGNLEDIESSKERDLAQSSEHQQEWIQQREQEKIQREQKELSSIRDYVENITKDHPWARFQEVPTSATPDQVKKIEAHNARVSDLAQKFNSALVPKTAEERAAVATAATLSHVVIEQLRFEQQGKVALQKQLAALQKENSMLKQSGKLPKSSIQGQSSPKSTLSDRIKMDASTAIDLGLDEAGA